jgi:predicted O-methyltransferase YrrM
MREETRLAALAYMTAEGWLTEAERKALFKYAAAVPPDGTIVNIGVEYGASVVCLKSGNPSAGLYAVDINLSPNRCPGDMATFIEGDSYIVAQEWPQYAKEEDLLVDLVFIDGDHSYEGVMRDTTWLSMVKTGGIAIFHDCFDWPPAEPRTVRPPCPEVNAAVQKWYDHNYYYWTELPEVDSMRIFKRVNNEQEEKQDS